ncbi:uncharacterized protein LOC135400011 [Ornithodoros turicata]|uniref:uncharacterized protein LOC135400011 n=1 Tax=Ornithodoros turicata TaxID=34597 RepID=UPI003139E761
MEDEPEPATQSRSAEYKSDLIAHRYVIIILMAALVCALFFLLWIYMSKYGGSHIQGDPSCCPEEVKRLASTVDRSLDPCGNFYYYVCSNYERLGLGPFLSIGDRLLHEIRRSGSVNSSQDKYHLWQYDHSCMNTIWPVTTFASDLTSGIIEEFAVRARMTQQEVALFLLRTNVVYRIGNVIAVIVNAKEMFSKIKAIAAFNSLLKTDVNQDAIKAVNDILPEQDYAHNFENFSLFRDIFSDVPQESWNELQDEAPVAFDTSKPIIISNVAKLKKVLSVLANPKNQPASVALMTVSAVFNALVRFKLPNRKSKSSSLYDRLNSICFQQLKSLGHLITTMYATELTNRAKDDHIIEIHTAVMKSISSPEVSGTVFSEEDQPLVSSVLQNIRLVLPSEYVLTDIDFPNMTDEFGRNFLRGLTYEAKYRQAKVRQQLPRDVNENADTMLVNNSLYVSSRYYAASNFESPNRMVLNMAIVGIRMAESLWQYLMTGRNWSNETSTKADGVLNCSHGSLVDAAQVSRRTLAVRTVLRALDRSGWNNKQTWQDWKLSLGEVFYMWYVNSECMPQNARGDGENVNAPLRKIEDFIETFQCPAGSSMAQMAAC